MATSNNLDGLASSSSSVGSSEAIKRPATASSSEAQVLDKKRLQELVREVDPNEQLDEDVEDLLLHIADDFIEQTVTASCALAKHRKANSVDVKDVQMVLERNWNMWIPGFGAEDVRPYKRSATTEAHKARMALIRKALKKY
jgi:transcription initiation factor TFIID subunit 12